MSGQDDFLGRWSRRKQEARLEPEPEAVPPPAKAPPDQRTEAEILEELGLPDPDTLGPGSDFRAFMAEAVPEFIRRRALKRLWGINPVLANLDELVDYGEDFTDKAMVVENLQTAWKVGQGYFDKFAVKDDAAGEETPEPVDVAEEEVAEPEPQEEPADPSDMPDEESAMVEEAPEPMPPTPRPRMRFSFDES